MTVLSAAELAEVTRHVTYPWPRGGWTFEVHPDPYLAQPRLLIIASVQDARDPVKVTDLGIWSVIPPCDTEGQYLRWLEYRVIEAQVHEARELFRYRGKIFDDPHAERGPG